MADSDEGHPDISPPTGSAASRPAGTAPVPRVGANGSSAPPNGRPRPAGTEPAEIGGHAGDAAEDDLVLTEDQPLLEEEPTYEDERARAFLAGGAYATVAIDRYDELASIFGKIDAAPAPRVALVAARGNRELERALSMRRLQRHLDLTGKDLILVTRSRALRLRAREEDLPAVGSLRRVNFQTYGRGGLRLGWLTLRLPSLGALVGVLLLVGAFAAGAAVLLWYLPKAEVTVFLPVTAQDATLELVLDGQGTVVNLESGTVPARRRDVSVTRSIYRPATGVIQVPTSNAAVALRFTSRTAQPVVVPKGTVVIANNGTRFTVANDVNLARQGAFGDVVALAQQPGTVGNVPANSIVRIEGDLAPRVAVTNLAPGEKGTDTPQQVVSEADIEGVRAFAEPILLDAALQELRTRFAESATVFEQSASVQITDVRGVPGVNQPGKFVDVRPAARVSLLTADDSDLRRIYENHFRPLLPSEEMLLEDQFTTTVMRTGELERTADRLPVTVQVRALTAPYLDRATLQAALAGQSKKGADQLIRSLVPGAPSPRVKISPGWAPRLPRKTDRITVTFAPAAP